MKRLVFVSLALLPLPNGALAEARIPVGQRVANRPPGYCAWCCLEMIGKNQRLPNLTGLVDWYAARTFDGASSEAVVAQLDEAGVSYDYRYRADLNFLRQQTDAGRAVMVGVWHWRSGRPHAVLVVNVTANKVYFIDPNRPRIDWSYTLAEFQGQWYGEAVVVLGRKRHAETHQDVAK